MTDIDILVVALNENRTVSFMYDDKPRTVEIHAIGYSTKDDSPIMRGFQVDGESSRPTPCWALFTISKIEDLAIDDQQSFAPRDGYKLNDKQMSGIIAQVEMEPVL